MTDRETVERYVATVEARAAMEGDKAWMETPSERGIVAQNSAGWHAERKVWADEVRALLAQVEAAERERDEARRCAEEYGSDYPPRSVAVGGAPMSGASREMMNVWRAWRVRGWRGLRRVLRWRTLRNRYDRADFLGDNFGPIGCFFLGHKPYNTSTIYEPREVACRRCHRWLTEDGRQVREVHP